MPDPAAFSLFEARPSPWLAGQSAPQFMGALPLPMRYADWAMKPSSGAQPESESAPPRSESERRLSARLRSNDALGALASERAGADMAYAMGHRRGLEEGQDAHLDSLRTILMRILEASGSVDDDTLDRVEQAAPRDLEDWIVRAALST